MSTESPTTPPTPAPADAPTPRAAVRAAWQKFKRGELVSYRVMAVLLIFGAGLVFFLYMTSQSHISDSKKWLDLELASTPEDLEKISTEYRDSVPAQLAEFHLARIRLAPEGMGRLVTGDPQERQKAIASIELAKETFRKMADELKNSPVMQAECYLGLAKAELALVGITKEGRINEARGDTKTAAEWLDKLAAVAEGTPWGDDAKTLASDLRNPDVQMGQKIHSVQTSLYNMALFPPPRPGGMFGPGGMPFGAGGMPFGAGGMPLGPGASPFGPSVGPISGLPGGGPVAPLPPGHPPIP